MQTATLTTTTNSNNDDDDDDYNDNDDNDVVSVSPVSLAIEVEALDVKEYLSELLSKLLSKLYTIAANVEPPLPVLFKATAAAVLLCTAVFSVLVGISRPEHASEHGLQGVHKHSVVCDVN
jgi:hypothetical protein